MKEFIYIIVIALSLNYAVAQSQGKMVQGSEATFAGGNFWRLQALFAEVKGVKEVVVGYAGGKGSRPNYDQVRTGRSGYVEAVNIKYDSAEISYAKLLKIYAESQADPDLESAQAREQGPEFKSTVFYRNDTEKREAEDCILKLNKSGRYKALISVDILPLTVFYRAEEPLQHRSDTLSPELKKFQLDHPRMQKQGKIQ